MIEQKLGKDGNMNKQELIKHFEEIPYVSISQMGKKAFIDMIEQLDEPEPIKLRDVIARIKQLDIGTRKVWLDEFLNELGSDYGTLKYKDGYEQGKLEGSLIPYEEPQKVTVPQFVGDFIAEQKKLGHMLSYSIDACMSDRVAEWYWDNSELFARAWLDGYTVEKEKRYIVKLKGISEDIDCINYDSIDNKWYLASDIDGCNVRTHHTRDELENAGFGWVFDCPGVEIEEVE